MKSEYLQKQKKKQDVCVCFDKQGNCGHSKLNSHRSQNVVKDQHSPLQGWKTWFDPISVTLLKQPQTAAAPLRS